MFYLKLYENACDAKIDESKIRGHSNWPLKQSVCLIVSEFVFGASDTCLFEIKCAFD